MADKTTLGVTAEPEEVEAVLHSLCGYHLSEPDPLTRYTALTREQVLYDGLVNAIRRERGRALAELAAAGTKLTQIAQMTNLMTRQRVQRLIALARAADEAEAAAAQVQLAQAASREFENKLAAVEATLDEVVSGIVPQQPARAEAEGVAVAQPAVATDPDPTGEKSQEQQPQEQRRHEEAHQQPSQEPHQESHQVAVVAGPAPTEPAVADPPAGAGIDFAPLLEPTEPLPALRGILHPTKEMPPATESVPWWRRVRDRDKDTSVV